MSWGKAQVLALKAAFTALDNTNIDWMVLRNHQGLPNVNRSKDVDIGVEKVNFRRAEKAISDALLRTGFDRVMVQNFQYIRCLTFFSTVESTPNSIKIDLVDGFPFRGAQVFNFRLLYSNAHRDSEFTVPDLVDDAVMLWCKPLVTGGIVKARYLTEIKYAAQSRPSDFKAELHRILTPIWANRVWSRIEADDIESTINMMTQLRKSVWWRAFLTNPILTLRNTVSHIITELVRRTQRNPATLFAVLGPDGVGKTTFIKHFSRMLGDLQFKDENSIKIYHFRPHMLPNINKLLTGKSEVISEFNNPHSAKPASMPSSFLRITYYWMDYLLGYWINLRGQIIKGRTIIFDRYFYDFIVDPRRSRLSLPGWIVGLYLTLTPKPDLIFFLDANADQIFTRKQELQPNEIKRQLTEYRKIVGKYPNRFVCLDASKSPEEIAKKAILEVVLRLYRVN